MNENLPFVIKFSRSNQDECCILCIFTSMACVEAVRVREMEKIYHEHAEVWAVKQLTLRCSSQNIPSGVDLITFRVIFFLSDGRYGFRRFSRVERWSPPVLFQDEKTKVDNRKQERSCRTRSCRCRVKRPDC